MRSLLFSVFLSLVVASNYVKMPKWDAINQNLIKTGISDVEKLKKLCDENPKCMSFNNLGILKGGFRLGIILPRTMWVKEELAKTLPDGVEPDPSVWPQPAEMVSGKRNAYFASKDLSFMIVPYDGDVYQATQKFETMTLRHKGTVDKPGSIRHVYIHMHEADTPITMDRDESYTMDIPADGEQINIRANTKYGVFHALATLGQLVNFVPDANAYEIKNVPMHIQDYPYYKYRGIMFDSATHFVGVPVIRDLIDGMFLVKLNTLHWHLSDNQAFSAHFNGVPGLRKGAYSRFEIYHPREVEEIVKYAASLGIMVIPEIDVPSHAQSMCKGYPGICPSADCPEPLDPSSDMTYEVLHSLLAEMFAKHGVMNGDVVHLGGNDVDTTCWSKTKHIVDWMDKKKYTPTQAHGHFLKKVHEFATGYNRTTVLWDDSYFALRDAVPRNTIIQVRKPENVKEIVSKGIRVIASPSKHWLLNDRTGRWQDVYKYDPRADIPRDLVEYVIGGEALLWGHDVDTSNLLPMVFPRATVLAERLWSNPERTSIETIPRRLSFQRCSMMFRGIPNSLAFYFGGDVSGGPNPCFGE